MISIARRLSSRLCSVLAVATAGALLSAAAAHAGLLPASSSCPTTTMSQPFAAWADPASYELAPGGDFESTGWGLESGATLAAGSESFAVTGSLGHQSLSLPAGAAATSPSFCVDTGKPTLRLFTAGGGLLEVEIQTGGATIPVGLVVASGTWAPSPIMLTGVSLLGPLTGTVQARIRLRAISGHPQVDDVFVDPWNRG
jgi:hypothetical protein